MSTPTTCDVALKPEDSIAKLGLTREVIRRLRGYGIFTIGQLTTRSCRRVLKRDAYWIGDGRLDEIEQALASEGLSLPPDPLYD